MIRAIRKNNNEIEYLAPKEFHANPVDPNRGSLVFNKFGWEILTQIKESGFQSASAYFFWSKEFCYLGDEQIIFIAKKS